MDLHNRQLKVHTTTPKGVRNKVHQVHQMRQSNTDESIHLYFRVGLFSRLCRIWAHFEHLLMAQELLGVRA